MTEQRAKWWRERIELAASTMTDADALEAIELCEKWKPDTEYGVDKRVGHEGSLYKCRQQHTSQEIYPPNLVPAIWTVITLEDGSREHPIHYAVGMELTQNLYYLEEEVLYICTRSTGIPVYNPLSALVGIYVEEVSNDV